MFDMNMDIQHLMEACDKSSGACSYNGKKKGNDANTNDPSSNEGCCKKEACPTTNEVCKNEGCKRESSIFDGMFQALDEFKGDAELQHQARDFHDFMSGSHEYSKAYKADKNGMRDELSARTGRDGQANSKAKKEELDKDKNDSREELKTLRNVANRDKLAKTVLPKESASIFDALFDQI